MESPTPSTTVPSILGRVWELDLTKESKSVCIWMHGIFSAYPEIHWYNWWINTVVISFKNSHLKIPEASVYDFGPSHSLPFPWHLHMMCPWRMPAHLRRVFLMDGLLVRSTTKEIPVENLCSVKCLHYESESDNLFWIYLIRCHPWHSDSVLSPSVNNYILEVQKTMKNILPANLPKK